MLIENKRKIINIFDESLVYFVRSNENKFIATYYENKLHYFFSIIEYYKSNIWLFRKTFVKLANNLRCEYCGNRFSLVQLQVHHKNYNFFEKRSDLICLCTNCHNNLHQNGKQVS